MKLLTATENCLMGWSNVSFYWPMSRAFACCWWCHIIKKRIHITDIQTHPHNITKMHQKRIQFMADTSKPDKIKCINWNAKISI